MAKSKYIETLEEQYTKKDAKSVLRYKAPDNKWRYVQTSKDASGGNIPSGGGMTEVTWQELKDKRDNKQLTPGSLYRITDYQCTTTQENTQSAGHQFDIVLLALSENKLAEEGWAMMHNNIYDVTFADGVTLKCYWYQEPQQVGNGESNLVVCSTMLGSRSYATNIDMEGEAELNVDTINKTATCISASTDLDGENIPYNYFYNSNLSAWKVWYCLDNDTSRFAWADDSVDETTLACITTTGNNKNFYRNKSGDVLGASFPYAWTSLENETKYTRLEEPESGRIAISNNPNGIPANVNITFTPGHEGTNLPNGRGVIYRLIDEWGNDVGYDFKNIQFIRPIKGGEYDAQGTDTWVYTFNAYNLDDSLCYDATMKNDIPIDDGKTTCKNNYISPIIVSSRNTLPHSIMYGTFSLDNDEYYEITHLQCISGTSSFTRCFNVTSYFGTGVIPIEDAANAIYINNKKVLTEE